MKLADFHQWPASLHPEGIFVSIAEIKILFDVVPLVPLRGYQMDEMSQLQPHALKPRLRQRSLTLRQLLGLPATKVTN